MHKTENNYENGLLIMPGVQLVAVEGKPGPWHFSSGVVLKEDSAGWEDN